MLDPLIIAQLAPHGTLRAGINLANTLLVSGKTSSGEPEGIAPDLAREVATRLGVPIVYVPFAGAGPMTDAAGSNVWDIGLIGAEPERMQNVIFTAPYVEIDATYLVPAHSLLTAVEQVDRPGVRIAVARRSAYDLWLTRNIKHAELVPANTLDGAYERFVEEELEALAGLKPLLLSNGKKLSGARLLEGRFMAVQQSVGTARQNEAGAAFLRVFIEEAKASGLVARLIQRHGVQGLSSAASVQQEGALWH
jgi:polar amino acid transport system substrate-binding protein